MREERLHYQRKRIEAFLNAIVRVLAKLKYDLDKNSLTVRARWWLNMKHRWDRGDYFKSDIFEGIVTRKSYTVFLRETGRYDCGATWNAYFDSMSQKLHPDVASCSTRWDSGDYLDNISRDFYKTLGATGPDWRPIDWIFSEFGSCQEEPQIPELTNSSKETGDEHSSERFNARQAAA